VTSTQGTAKAAPTKPRLSASAWAAIATAGGTALLLYTGMQTGEWRGVVVSEVQILVVGLTTFFVLRED
jgi:hypothetical protein